MRTRAIGMSIGLFVMLVVGMGLSVRWVAAEAGGTPKPFGDAPAYGSQVFFEGMGFVQFDMTNPEAGTVLTSTPSFFRGIDFANDAFGTAYALSTTTLVAVNTVSGAETVIGAAVPITDEAWSGMTWDPTTITMYAVAHTACDGSATASLYTLNLATGAATRVGAVSNGGCLGDIAAHPTSGVLYGVNSELDMTLTIDKATGAGTVLGSLGFNARDSEHGMDFDDSTAILYYAHNLGPGCCSGLEVYRVGTTTGTLTRIYQGLTELGMDDFAIAVAAPDGAPQIAYDPVILGDSHVFPPEITTQTLVLTNTGDAPLSWFLYEDEDPKPSGTPAPAIPPESRWNGVVSLAEEAQVVPPALVHESQPAGRGDNVPLVLDDGTLINLVGRDGGGQFIWLNRFTPNPEDFPFTLTRLELYGGSGSGCTTQTVDFYLYEDADGDPTNGARFVGSLLNQTLNGNDSFQSYPVNIEMYGVGDVLIGVVNRDCVGVLNEPAAIDTSTSQQRSWFGYYTEAPGNPPVLPPPTFGLIDSFGVAGNWMVRGYGIKNDGSCSTTDDFGWFSTDPVSGTIAPGESSDVTVTYDSYGVVGTAYLLTGTLCLESNDPDTALAQIPVYLAFPIVDAVTLADLSVTSDPPWLAMGFFGLLAVAGFVAWRRKAVDS